MMGIIFYICVCVVIFLLLYSCIESKAFQIGGSHKSSDLIFVIVSYIKNEKQQELLKRCIESINRFHPLDQIVIIDDNSELPLLPKSERLKNYQIIKSEYHRAGELLPYYYYWKYQGFGSKKMVFLHDSMFLSRALTKEETDSDVRFHWHFETHRYDNMELIKKMLKNLKSPITIPEKWYGCFGVASTISLKTLNHLQSKYEFCTLLLPLIKTREDRCCLERVFAILCFVEKYVTLENCSNFGDILLFPGHFSDWERKHKKKSMVKSKNYAILKTWQGR